MHVDVDQVSVLVSVTTRIWARKGTPYIGLEVVPFYLPKPEKGGVLPVVHGSARSSYLREMSVPLSKFVLPPLVLLLAFAGPCTSQGVPIAIDILWCTMITTAWFMLPLILDPSMYLCYLFLL